MNAEDPFFKGNRKLYSFISFGCLFLIFAKKINIYDYTNYLLFDVKRKWKCVDIKKPVI